MPLVCPRGRQPVPIFQMRKAGPGDGSAGTGRPLPHLSPAPGRAPQQLAFVKYFLFIKQITPRILPDLKKKKSKKNPPKHVLFLHLSKNERGRKMMAKTWLGLGGAGGSPSGSPRCALCPALITLESGPRTETRGPELGQARCRGRPCPDGLLLGGGEAAGATLGRGQRGLGACPPCPTGCRWSAPVFSNMKSAFFKKVKCPFF